MLMSLAQQRPDPADHARHVVVLGEQEVALQGHVQVELVHADDAGLVGREHRAPDLALCPSEEMRSTSMLV